RPNWLPPPPHKQESVAPSSLSVGSGGVGTLASGRGGGGANSDEGTDILVQRVLKKSITVP
ncbi:MAG: hypothetical protein ACK56F_14570, partial [bacterium]